MRAYSVELDQPCSEQGCTRRATREVRNGQNAPIRRCCDRHAAALVASLNSEEKRGA